jgi:hypothetical protein
VDASGGDRVMSIGVVVLHPAMVLLIKSDERHADGAGDSKEGQGRAANSQRAAATDRAHQPPTELATRRDVEQPRITNVSAHAGSRSTLGIDGKLTDVARAMPRSADAGVHRQGVRPDNDVR